MTLSLKRWFHWFTALSFTLALSLSSVSVVGAQGILPGETSQTNPKDRVVEITAIVPVQEPPPVPILIRPQNNSISRSGEVLFRWEEVIHTASIDRYELYINGVPKFSFIHTINQETDDYILTYDPIEGEYSLQLKPGKGLSDGVYTWKIRVIDSNDRGTDSTTWTFTIDSTPPPIIVTEIDGDPYAISASDPTTFPDQPIVVDDRTPLIKGNSESGSKLQVVVKYPDGTIWQTYTTTVGADGSFEIQFGELPIDQIMHLTFTAIDPADNTTVLDAIDLVYRLRVIVIPLPDIFPVPMTIRIRIPGKIIDIPDLFPPKEVPDFQDRDGAPISAPTEQVFTRPVQPRGIFVFGAWFGLGWYVLALFWITGNSWSWFPSFLKNLLRLWVFQVSSKESWQIVRSDTAEPLPFVAYTLRILTDKKHYQEHKTVSSLSGFGQTSIALNAMTHVQSQTKRFVYTIDRIYHSKSRSASSQLPPSISLESLVVDGEDFVISDRIAHAKQIDEQSMLLPVGKPLYLLFQSVRSEEVRSWQVWFPQFGLTLGVLSSLALAYYVPTWWSFALLIFLAWIGLRDVSVQMRKKMSVYAKQ